MSERKQAPETPLVSPALWALGVSGAAVCGVGSLRKGPAVRAPDQAQRAWQVVSQGCVYDLGRDLTRHNCFRYCNRGSLSSAYFAQATAALSDGYIYLALTHSNSPAGEVIGLFTGRAYNHISLAFDRALKTLVSYNGGEGGEAPGLNPETLKGLAERKGASVRGVPPGGHPPSKNRSCSSGCGKSTRRAAPIICWAFSFPCPASPILCSARSLSTPCCAWRGCTIFERTPCRCAPQTLWSGTAGGEAGLCGGVYL